METQRIGLNHTEPEFLCFILNRFYKAEEKMIPEIFAVAEFMAAQLGDCTGDMENTFMTLRVRIWRWMLLMLLHVWKLASA